MSPQPASASRLPRAALAAAVLGLGLAAGAQQPGSNPPSPATPAPAATAPAANPIALPEPVDPALLAKVLMDQPGSYAVLDLRPAWQFAEWHIAGAANVTLADVAARVAALPAATRVVLVDRDGTTAFAVAGALMAQRPDRVLRVLEGGVQRWFREIELGQHSRTGPAGGPAPATPNPAAPRRRGTGC